MRIHFSQTLLGSVLATIFVAFWLWQSPGVIKGKLTATEVNRYLDIIDRNLPFPPAEKPLVLERLRIWAEADDGKPFYMLNLMRFHEKLNRFPGTPEFAGTPQDANRIYEDAVIPLLLNTGSYPLFGSETQGANLLGHQPALDNWSRVLLVRYTSRRAFFDLLTHPDYAPMAPYKFMALQVLLLPTTGDIVVPDLRWPIGAGLLVIFLAVGWVRAARRAGQGESCQSHAPGGRFLPNLRG